MDRIPITAETCKGIKLKAQLIRKKSFKSSIHLNTHREHMVEASSSKSPLLFEMDNRINMLPLSGSTAHAPLLFFWLQLYNSSKI